MRGSGPIRSISIPTEPCGYSHSKSTSYLCHTLNMITRFAPLFPYELPLPPHRISKRVPGGDRAPVRHHFGTMVSTLDSFSNFRNRSPLSSRVKLLRAVLHSESTLKDSLPLNLGTLQMAASFRGWVLKGKQQENHLSFFFKTPKSLQQVQRSAKSGVLFKKKKKNQHPLVDFLTPP